MMPAGKENLSPCSFQLAHVLELVPELGTDDSGKDDHGDDVECICIHAVANEVPVQQNCAADGGEPEEQAERSDMSKTEVQIGKHAGISIAASNRGEHRRLLCPRFPQLVG